MLKPTLMKPCPEAGPPIDYLLSRVRSRRAQLDLSGRQDPWPGLGVEEGLLAAYRWLFERLNTGLLRQLQPYLEVLAGNSLVQALRLFRAEKREALVHHLQRSLLHPGLQQSILEAASAERLVQMLDEALVPDCPELTGLFAIYQSQGPGGVEEKISVALLQRALATTRTNALQQLLVWLVDVRNVLVVAKYWHWQLEQSPLLLVGGHLPVARLRRFWAERDEAGLGQATARLANVTAPVHVNARTLEWTLLRGITGVLHRLGREPLGVGVVVDYLWRCRVAARNRALTLSLADGAGTLLDEVQVPV